MFVNSDFSDLLRIFNEHNVKYMVVGGYAVVQYAEPRYTKDLDVLIATLMPKTLLREAKDEIDIHFTRKK